MHLPPKRTCLVPIHHYSLLRTPYHRSAAIMLPKGFGFRLGDLDSSLRPATYYLCDLRKFTLILILLSLICTSGILSMKQNFGNMKRILNSLQCSVQFSHSIVSDSLRPHESQHVRPPCPSPTPRVHSDSCPSSP